VVLVWRLDRWGRSVTDLLATLQELEHLGVGFVSLTQALDLTTPAGQVMAGLLAIFAEFERGILRERVRAGLALARHTANAWVDPLRLACTPRGSGNSIVITSAWTQSRANSVSAAPRSVGS
jgi:DNA invertase Pin-like site-specific DNA recombinase